MLDVRRGLLLGAMLAALEACGGGMASAPSPALGTRVTASMSTDAGATLGVPDTVAKSVVLYFWAPGLAACKATIPALLKKKWDLEAKGARLVLVASLGEKDSADDARTVLSSWGVDEHFAIDRGHAFADQLGAHDVPAIVIVDHDGIVRWVSPDGVTMSDVMSALP